METQNDDFCGKNMSKLEISSWNWPELQSHICLNFRKWGDDMFISMPHEAVASLEDLGCSHLQ